MASRVPELIAGALRLSGRERREVVRAWCELPAVWLALHLDPARRLVSATTPDATSMPPRREGGAAAAREAARLVRAAARLSPFPSTCLTRSIVLSRLLRRRGLAAGIRIGVRRGEGPFAAHAWVEVDGEPVSDRADVAERHAAFAESLAPTS
jgi:hypothetical protein